MHLPPSGLINSHARAAYTLIELLITISVVAVLVGLLVPGVYVALEKGKSAKCMGNLRAVGTAMLGYIDEYQYGPPSSTYPFWEKTSAERLRKKRWHWITYLAPYLGSPDYEGPVSSVFDCPSDPNVKTWPKPRFYLPKDDSDEHNYSSYGYSYTAFGSSMSEFYSDDPPGKPRCPPVKYLKNPSAIFLVTEGRANRNAEGTGPSDKQQAIVYYTNKNFPSPRHLGRFNAFFLDGHIENLPAADGQTSKRFRIDNKRTDGWD